MANQDGIFKKQVDEKVFTLGANTQDFVIDQGYPIGAIRRLWMRVFSTAFAVGGGVQVTDGEKRLLRNVTVESTLHGVLYQNVDGLGLYRLWTLIFGTAPATRISTTAFSTLFQIPFGYLGLLRHPSKRLNDMVLWARTAKIKTTFTIGTLTDLVTGGAPSGAGKARLTAEYQPNPNPAPYNDDPKVAGDMPGLQIEVVRQQNSALSTAGLVDTFLPIGQSRNLIAILIRELDNNGNEVGDIFTADVSGIELRHGSDVIYERAKVTDIDDLTQDLTNIAKIPGNHLIYLPADGRLTDARALDAVQELKLTVDNLNNATNRVLAFYLVFGKPVKSGAEPAAQQ